MTLLRGYSRNIIIALISCCMMQLSCLSAHADAGAKRDQAITANYYAGLIATPKPDLAALTLFANMLPKGGDLHHHYSGAIYVETYLQWLDERNFCIYRKDDAELKAQKYRIETRPQTELSQASQDICISAAEARKDNPFYRELLKRWSDKDFGNHSHEQPAPDQQFFDTFGYFSPVSNSDYHQGLQELKGRAKAENVQYLETMLKRPLDMNKPELGTKIDALSAQSSDTELEAALTAFADFMANDATAQSQIATYVADIEADAAGLDDADFTLRFQAYVLRNNNPARVFSTLYSAFAAAHASKLIVGVNIVGPENEYVAMRDYSLHMRMFRFLKKRYPEVKLSLHAGELALGMVPPEGLQSHIREAIEVAGAQRIGHGVDIAHEAHADALLKLMRQRGIPVEINLTSNAFILGVADEAHPIKLYSASGVPFVISSDDPGVARNNLSSEYLLYISRYKPTYKALKKVVYNSIRYAFLDPDEKQAELARLDKRFASFEARVAAMAASNR